MEQVLFKKDKGVDCIMLTHIQASQSVTSKLKAFLGMVIFLLSMQKATLLQ